MYVFACYTKLGDCDKCALFSVGTQNAFFVELDF